MSISTTIRIAGPFAGNDIQTVFAFAFKVFTTADVLVARDIAGVETELVLGTDYTVSLNADQDAAPGGSITLTAPLATGHTLALTSDVEPLQSVTVANGGGFFPAVFNGVFDKLTILIQQLTERASRAFTVPLTYAGSVTLPVTPSGVLQWASDGLSLTAVTLPDLSLILALPAQAGHANHALYSNGVTADWRAPLISDVTGLSSSLNYLNARIGSVPTLEQVRAAAQAAALAEIASFRNFATCAAVVF